MRNQKGYVAGYSGQLVVTTGQVIVGAMLSQHPAGRTVLHPLLDRCRGQLTAAGLRLLAPLAKDPARRNVRTPQHALHLDRFPATARARRRLRHPRGRDDYKLRARTVEPVFGQLKTCQKLTMMSGAAWPRASFTGCSSNGASRSRNFAAFFAPPERCRHDKLSSPMTYQGAWCMPPRGI